MVGVGWGALEDWEVWLKQARRFEESAKIVLNEDFHEVAYYLALHAGELALKTVLVKCGVFEKKDETHDMLKLLQKIENNGCLPSHVLFDLRRIVEWGIEPGIEVGLNHVDVGALGGVRISCGTATETARIRYPIGSEAPYQYIDRPNARNKVELSDELIAILEKHLAHKG